MGFWIDRISFLQASVHREERWGVIIRLREVRVDERRLVDLLAQVREDFGRHLAAVAARGERERRLHQAADLVFEDAGGVFEGAVELAG